MNWLLRRAAQRWPADLRDDMEREWRGEMGAIDGPAAWLRRLTFVASLAFSPPVPDENGVPHGWREHVPGRAGALSPFAALLLAALATTLVRNLSNVLFSRITTASGLDLAASDRWAPVAYVVPFGFAVLAGWWLARRMSTPVNRAYAVGPASALIVLAGLAATVPAWVPVVTVLVWAPLMIWVTRRAAAEPGRRALAYAVPGTAVAVVLAAAAVAVPLVLTTAVGPAAALRYLVGVLPGQVTFAAPMPPNADDRMYQLVHVSGTLVELTTFSLLVLSFGLTRSRRAPAPVPEKTQAPIRSGRPAATTGLAGLALAVVAWAYTLTVLTPAMPRTAAVAPMPGGDGEIYLWVAELRWASILLAAVCLFLAAADRPRAVAATGVLVVALLGADGLGERLGREGLPAFVLALVVGGVVALSAWKIAGPPYPHAVVRQRLTAVAVIAALSWPLLGAQGTPLVNHPFLPLGLPILTTAVMLGFGVSAVVAARTARGRASGLGTALLALVPAALSVGFGVLHHVLDDPMASAPLLFVILYLVVIAWMLLHREGSPRSASVVRWTALTFLTPVLYAAFVYGGVYGPAEALFRWNGTSYPADGISLVPGSAVLATAVGAALAGLLVRRARPLNPRVLRPRNAVPMRPGPESPGPESPGPLPSAAG
ncbi:hypothetical protein [Cryptosporangium japonicum]|uniref:Integral membrane protein n=1 Tax=Cryptosporangium japonicum TaxID=80872 RepID=A0ABN0U838_9ACTN